MLSTIVAGVALLAGLSMEPAAITRGVGPQPGERLSLAAKHAAVDVLVRTATDCIVRSASAEANTRKGKAVGDAIVSSIETCVSPVRAMIDGYDRHFGEGTGEAFFMGPYLEVLPKAVMREVEKETP